MSSSLPIGPAPRIAGPYTASAGQTTFTFDFPVLDAGDVRVETAAAATPDAWLDAELGNDYAVPGAFPLLSGGSVVFADGRAAGTRVRILGRAAIANTQDPLPGGKVDSQLLNRFFDRQTIWAQEARRDIDEATERLGLVDGSTAIEASQIAVSAAGAALDHAEQAAAQVAAAGDQVALAAGQVALAGVERAGAETARAAAETARDASFANAKGDTTIALARARVADGETFVVYAPGALTYDAYRRESSSTQTLLGTYPAASRVAAMEANVALAAQQLGRDLDEGYVSGSVGATTGTTSTGTTGGIYSPAALQSVRSKLTAVRFRATVVGTYEVHVYRQLSATTFKLVAVWSGTVAATGLVTLAAGGGVIPEGYILEVGDTVCLKLGTLRIGYGTATTGWASMSANTGVGAVSTRTTSMTIDLALAYDYAGIVENIEGRLDALEDTAKARSASAAAKSLLLAPPVADIPAGYVDTGVEVSGLRVIAPDAQAVIDDVFGADGEGFAILPNLSAMYQDSGGTNPADASGDPVYSITDLAPTPATIATTSDAYRPTLRIDGRARSLRFDGSDDRIAYPALTSRSAITLVASIAVNGYAAYPQIIGDSNATLGLFCGLYFGRPRFAFSGITQLFADDPIPMYTRVTLSYVYDGAHQRIYRDGVLVAEAVCTGAIPAGTAAFIGYIGGFSTPLDIYGAILVDRAVSADERIAMEAIVSGRYDAGLQATVEAAKKESLRDIGAYYGIKSSLGTKAYALGDSTVGIQFGNVVMDFVTSTKTKITLAVPGHTIAQQLAVWQATTIVPDEVAWVVVQIGLNDLNPAEAAYPAIGRLQLLINTIRKGIGDRPLLVSQMVPCRQRMIDMYGGTNGPIAWQKWLDINAAIAGEGPTPITNVDGRVTAHVPLLDDGSGNLAAPYDTGDHIHTNNAGRAINATAWADAVAAIRVEA